MAGNFWFLMGLMTLVPVGTALTFPSTTALISQWTEKAELGTTMGTSQAFAGLSRTVSPLIATALFQQLGHSIPFFAGAFYAGIVVLLSLKVRDAAREPRETRGESPTSVLQEEPVESR